MGARFEKVIVLLFDKNVLSLKVFNVLLLGVLATDGKDMWTGHKNMLLGAGLP